MAATVRRIWDGIKGNPKNRGIPGVALVGIAMMGFLAIRHWRDPYLVKISIAAIALAIVFTVIIMATGNGPKR